MRNKIKNIIKNVLLIFVFVSIGYVLGKHSVTRTGIERVNKDSNSVVHVYYMHTTFRCATCNNIEKMTKALLEKYFKSELNSGKLLFSEVNFQKDETLAKQFGVAVGCVVVSDERNGKVLDFKRIDEVWELKDKPEEFDSHISKIIKEFLEKASAK